MILSIVDAADATLELAEADDSTSFKVTGQRPMSDESRAALAGRGVVLSDDDEHAFVEPATIEGLAGDVDQRWTDRFAGMVEFAASKGWTDDDGRIRGHCEWA